MIEKTSAHLPSRHTVAVILATLAALAVALAAFARSFSALSHLAVMHDWPADQAWILPISLDGMIVVPTVAAVVVRHRRRLWYVWALLVAGTILSVAGNGIHAWLTTSSVIAVGLAVIPPIVTLAAVHLAIVIAHHTDDTATDPTKGTNESIHVVAAPTPPTQPVTQLRSVATATVQLPATTPPVATRPAAPRRDISMSETRPVAPRRETPIVASRPTSVVAPLPDTDDALKRRALQLVADGMSRRAVAAELGVSKDKVQRWATENETVAV